MYMFNVLKYIYVYIKNERWYKVYIMYRNYGLYMDVYVLIILNLNIIIGD